MADDSSTPGDEPATDAREPYEQQLLALARKLRWRGLRDERVANVAAVLGALADGEDCLVATLAELVAKEAEKRATKVSVKARTEMIEALADWDGRDPPPSEMADRFMFEATAVIDLSERLDLHPDNPASNEALTRVAQALANELGSEACDRDQGVALTRAGFRALGFDDVGAQRQVAFFVKRRKRPAP